MPSNSGGHHSKENVAKLDGRAQGHRADAAAALRFEPSATNHEPNGNGFRNDNSPCAPMATIGSRLARHLSGTTKETVAARWMPARWRALQDSTRTCDLLAHRRGTGAATSGTPADLRFPRVVLDPGFVGSMCLCERVPQVHQRDISLVAGVFLIEVDRPLRHGTETRGRSSWPQARHWH